MECGEAPHEVALLLLEAVALVHDGVHGAAIVVAGRKHGDGQRPLCIIRYLSFVELSRIVEYFRPNSRIFTA